MPVFAFSCSDCGVFRRVLEKTAKFSNCKKCGKKSPRQETPPSTLVMETIDTGSQQKPVERFSEAPQLFKERSKIEHD